jgi:hypothetical protein
MNIKGAFNTSIEGRKETIFLLPKLGLHSSHPHSPQIWKMRWRFTSASIFFLPTKNSKPQKTQAAKRRDTSARASSQNIMHTCLKASKLSIFPCCLPRHGVRLLGKHVSAGAAPACRDVRWSWRPCKRRYGASSPPHQAPNTQTSSSSPSP